MEQKFINGHEYVDLGLPNGTLWATCNVGASSPEELGDYFAWGETTPKPVYNWGTYKYGSDWNRITKYCTDSYYGSVDNKTVLDSSDDVATANWDCNWCMPTEAQWKELRQYCTWTWTTMTNSDGEEVCGYQVVSNFNGKSIFLPAAGCRDDSGLFDAGSWSGYWSSSLNSYFSPGAYFLYFDSGDDVNCFGSYRFCGLSVRPVLISSPKNIS